MKEPYREFHRSLACSPSVSLLLKNVCGCRRLCPNRNVAAWRRSCLRSGSRHQGRESTRPEAGDCLQKEVNAAAVHILATALIGDFEERLGEVDAELRFPDADGG